MCKSFVLLFFLLFFLKTNAQSIQEYVNKNTVAINTNSPDSSDFSDLEVIGNAIGDARVIMLGEQDHGDAPAFLAKTRLIKYLHEKKGFDVLAFESDFFALNEGMDALQNSGASSREFLRQNIYPIWAKCDACENLFYNYIPSTSKTSTPIIVTGFDNQTAGVYSAKYLSKRLDSVLRANSLPIMKDPNFSQEFLSIIDSLALKNIELAKQSKLDSLSLWLGHVKSQLSQVLLPDDFWILTVDNLLAQCEQYKNHLRGGFES